MNTAEAGARGRLRVDLLLDRKDRREERGRDWGLPRKGKKK